MSVSGVSSSKLSSCNFTLTLTCARDLQDIIAYLPVWKEYVREFLLSSVEDGISYVEPRVFFYVKFVSTRSYHHSSHANALP